MSVGGTRGARFQPVASIIENYNKCNDRQTLTSDGKRCVDCPPYKRAFNNNEYCAVSACTDNQVFTYDGGCETCPYGTSPNWDFKVCVTPK